MNRLVAVVLLAAACTPARAGMAPPERGATAVLRDAQGSEAGTAQLTAVGADSVRVTVRLAGGLAGRHGVHIHRTGRCDGPDFASAGGHLNPYGRQHGHLNPRGPHAGDAGNLDGGRLEAVLAVPLDSILDGDGSAVVVHAAADDEITDPSGNSGARVLCGVVAATAPARRTAP